jgi:hypothetical protein
MTADEGQEAVRLEPLTSDQTVVLRTDLGGIESV